MATPMIYVAASAVLVGDVSVADGASVWHGAVLRGDFDAVQVGRDSNVQDNAVLHVDRGMPCIIGDRVTVGHGAVVHGCTIGDECIVGMNATINSGASVGRGSFVASGAVLKEEQEFPEGSVIGGVPAKVLREIDGVLRKRIDLSWMIYRELAKSSLPARTPIPADPSRQVALEMSEEFTRLVRED